MPSLRSLASSLVALIGFILLVLGVGGLVWLSRASLEGAGLGGIVVIIVVVAVSIGFFIIGNIAFFMGASMDGMIARILSIPVTLIDLIASLVVALIAVRALARGEIGLAVFSGVISLILVALTAYYARRALGLRI